MRRITLLALLALALPTASLATSFNFDTGTSVSGTVLSFMSGASPLYTVTGNGLTFTFNLTDVDCPGVTCSFSGGSVAVTNAASVVLVTDSLQPGRFTRTPTGVDSQLNDVFSGIQLTTKHGVPQVAFGTLSGNVVWQNTNNPLVISGELSLTGAFASVPEPSALEGLLVGFGMFGFAAMTSRRHQNGT